MKDQAEAAQIKADSQAVKSPEIPSTKAVRTWGTQKNPMKITWNPHYYWLYRHCISMCVSMYMCIYICIHTHVYTRYMYIYIQTYLPTYIHAYIHKYIISYPTVYRFESIRPLWHWQPRQVKRSKAELEAMRAEMKELKARQMPWKMWADLKCGIFWEYHRRFKGMQ